MEEDDDNVYGVVDIEGVTTLGQGTVTIGGVNDNAVYTYDTASTTWMSTDSAPPRLKVGDRDVMQEIDELRDAVLLLKREVNMEAKYPELKRLKDEYEAALDKYKTFDAIKDSK
jgi:hypothetical protein